MAADATTWAAKKIKWIKGGPFVELEFALAV